jgi:hypothetical protein
MPRTEPVINAVRPVRSKRDLAEADTEALLVINAGHAADGAAVTPCTDVPAWSMNVLVD